jgi:hypothetical protein
MAPRDGCPDRTRRRRQLGSVIRVRRGAAASPPLRVVIDARMDEGSGGVQQWVIGLAGALSRLTDGPEDYRFLVGDGNGA